jgi:Fic family protein
MVLGLQRTALDGISLYAGLTRPANVEISGSKHAPPGAHLVPALLEDMCDYVNEHWETTTALHLAAYVMWRVNWIHPFVDGNGRTSRAVSYLVLCAKLGYPLPGTNTIPEQIAGNKSPYYDALESADVAWRARQVIDVTALEKLIEAYLSVQLIGVVEQASGTRIG